MHNNTVKHILMYTLCFCLICITASIGFYFLKILPDEKKEALALQANDLRIKQAQIDIEKSKIEIQDRETSIKEEANERAANETNVKIKAKNDAKAEVKKCRDEITEFLSKAYTRAGCIAGRDCSILPKDGEYVNILISICDSTEEKNKVIINS